MLLLNPNALDYTKPNATAVIAVIDITNQVCYSIAAPTQIH